jgi:hypothetical protein
MPAAITAAIVKTPVSPICETSRDPIAIPEIMPLWNPNTMIAAPRVLRRGPATASRYDWTPMNSMPWPMPEIERASMTVQMLAGIASMKSPMAARPSPPYISGRAL